MPPPGWTQAGQSRDSLRALAAMAAGAAVDAIALADEIGFEVHRTGLLVPFRTAGALEAYRASHTQVESMGYRGRVELLDVDGIRAREPSLGGDVIGGLHLLDEVSVRPNSMTVALARALTVVGGEYAEHETVRSITPEALVDGAS